eukprot:1643332-Rhodomonas_salina.1
MAIQPFALAPPSRINLRHEPTGCQGKRDLKGVGCSRELPSNLPSHDSILIDGEAMVVGCEALDGGETGRLGIVVCVQSFCLTLHAHALPLEPRKQHAKALLCRQFGLGFLCRHGQTLSESRRRRSVCRALRIDVPRRAPSAWGQIPHRDWIFGTAGDRIRELAHARRQHA